MHWVFHETHRMNAVTTNKSQVITGDSPAAAMISASLAFRYRFAAAETASTSRPRSFASVSSVLMYSPQVSQRLPSPEQPIAGTFGLHDAAGGRFVDRLGQLVRIDARFGGLLDHVVDATSRFDAVSSGAQTMYVNQAPASSEFLRPNGGDFRSPGVDQFPEQSAATFVTQNRRQDLGRVAIVARWCRARRDSHQVSLVAHRRFRAIGPARCLRAV